MPSNNELAEDRTKLAHERTDYAEDRTILANERTFAGWMRTGLASAGIGLGFQAIFREVQPTWLAKAGATVFIIIALIVFYLAYRKASSLEDKMHAHEAEPMGHIEYGGITLLFAAGSTLLGVLLWFL